MNGSPIHFVDAASDLGLLIDITLKFHPHIRVTTNKASGIASNLLKSTVSHDSSFVVSLYLTHIRPVIEFFSVIWHTGYEGDLTLLEGVQRCWTK